MPQQPLKTRNLFKGFPSATKERWLNLIQSKTTAPAFEKLVQGKSLEGVSINPVYAAEDYQNKIVEKSSISFNSSSQTWLMQEIVFLEDPLSVSKANAQLLSALEGGAESLLIDLSEYSAPDIDLKNLLRGVHLDAVDISFHLGTGPLLLNKFLLGEKRGTLYINPLESYMTKGVPCSTGLEKMEKLLKSNLKDYRCLAVSAYPFANCGATVAEEIALCCNLLLEYLDHFTEKGIPAQHLFDNLEITLSTRTVYLADIAKFRAVNLLLDKIMTSYNLDSAVKVPLRAVSASYNKSAYDPNTNLLRNTTEAMAAILGNCQKLCLIPHTGKRSGDNEFGLRMARNVSHLLRHESHLNLVEDPLGGSYALESLTAKIAEEAWTLFRKIEAEGGLIAAFDSGKLQAMLSKSAANYLDKIRILEQTAVGANRYVPSHNLNPRVNDFNQHSPAIPNLSLLAGINGPAVIEGIRIKVDETVGRGKKRPLIGIITLSGTSKAAVVSQRMAFVEDILTAIGLDTTKLEAKFMAAELKDEHFDALVIVGDNDEYNTLKAEQFRAIAKSCTKPLILAGYPNSIAQKMQNFGISNFIHASMNIPIFAEQFFNEIKFFN